MIDLRPSRAVFSAMVVSVIVAVWLSVAPGRAADFDPSRMSTSEVKALEQRLAAAGCYGGQIDGQASAALDKAIKACPDQRPTLRIETGMHTATIWRIGVDASCGRLVTASDDKTVRVWSLPDGTLQRVIRPPIGDGNAGRVYAVALSPDGRFAAAGGWDAAYGRDMGDGLYVTDLAAGTTRRLGGFPNVIHRIAFSADGARIAVALGRNSGMRVLDRDTGRELGADRDYASDTYGLAFAPDGTLVAVSFDGFIRRYGVDLKLTMPKVRAPDGSRPEGVAIDPSGQRLAIGYDDTAAVSILDAATLGSPIKADTQDLTGGDLVSVAWSHDGRQLSAAGKAQAVFEGHWRNLLRRFTPDGKRAGPDVGVADDTIMDLQRCGNAIAFGSADRRLGLVSPDGTVGTLQAPVTADMRGKIGTALTVSADAAAVRFGLGYAQDNPVLFDLLAGTLTDAPTVTAGMMSAATDGLPVTDWHSNTAPKFDGKPIAQDDYETAESLAVRADHAGFVLGSDYGLGAFDSSGKKLWRTPSPGVAWGVDLAAQGRIIVTAYGDGTIRWSRWEDGTELLAFFVHAPTKRWVAWTPSGYYMASPGAEDLIGWHVNRGWNQQADFFPASQFRADYNRPDIVKLVLKTLDEAEAVRQANALAQRETAKSVAAALPPVVTILAPSNGFRPAGSLVAIAYSLRSPSGLPVDRLDVLADGQRVEMDGFDRTNGEDTKGRVEAVVPKTAATLTLIAYSGGLTSTPVSVKLTRDPPVGSPPNSKATNAPDLRPKLIALLVGVRPYQNPKYDTLQFPDQDAQAVSAALMSQDGLDNGLYAHVETRVVDAPTRANVIDGLYWLQHEATSSDVVVVFLSGHGIKDTRQNFWFLTREADLGRLRATAISNDDLSDILAGIPGKKVLFIDACHAGAALVSGLKVTPEDVKPDMNKLVEDFAAAGSGLIVYAASMGTELAREEPSVRHGAFAEALIEAIGQGKAGGDENGGITTDMLDQYLKRRVQELTHGEQHPVMNRNLIPDFPLAVSRR